jgi:Fe-S cluster assembly protein SufD
MDSNLNLKDKIISRYKEFEESLNGLAKNKDGNPEKIHYVKLDALKSFKQLGFPGKKSEDWKYTNITPIIQKDYSQKKKDKAVTVTKTAISDFVIPKLKANLLVFINGIFSRKLSDIITPDTTAYIGSFNDAYNIHKELFELHFGKYADYQNNGLTALNTSHARDGGFIYLPKDKVVEEPIHLLFVSDTRTKNILSQPRNLIIAGENSKATIIESYHSLNHNYSFTNAVTEIFVNKNSEIEHYKIQDEVETSYNISTTQVNQERDSRYRSVTITWGGSIVRNNLNSVLSGENAECTMIGLYTSKGKVLYDNHTLVDHAVPNCNSNELYKGIIDDNSNGVFNGKIMVRKDAQKINAYQSNKNIVLSDKAGINSKPQLEIFADDVKCSHGATTGQLDKEQLFYLRARGIGKAEAQNMLLIAFANDIIENIKLEPLRNKLYDTLIKKLSDESRH